MASFTKTWHNKSYDFIAPSRPQLSAAGKNVIVTGGGTGIGKAIATSFAEAGAKSVSILGRRIDRLKATSEEIEAAAKGTKVIYKSVDLTVSADAVAAIKSIADEVGKIDILVANAASLPEPGSINTYDAAKLVEGFKLNVVTTLNSLQAFQPNAATGATVINVATALVHIPPMPGVAAYAVSKAAGVKLVDYFAAENPEIHVVHIHPGVVETELNQSPGQNDATLPGHFSVWVASSEAAFLRNKIVWVNWDAEELIAQEEQIKSGLLTWTLEGLSK